MKSFPTFTADEAASLISHGSLVGFSGFTCAGAAKAVPEALGRRAERLHAAGRPFHIGVMTGASAGPSLDRSLSLADAIAFRTPYQSDPTLRRAINQGRIKYFDMHLSTVAQSLRCGFFGPMEFAVVEACEITPHGEIVPTTSVGNSATFCRMARRVLVERNRRHPISLRGFHDIYEPADPPHRRAIPIDEAGDRIGQPAIRIDPEKILGIVETCLDDEVEPFSASTEVLTAIGKNVATFLAAELASGRIPRSFLPVQSGVGNIANAVLLALRDQRGIPHFDMFTEVIQDSAVELLRAGKVAFASGTALAVSPGVLRSIYEDMNFFRNRLLLRPQEISNHPEIIRRLGVISINTAIEADLFGNVNSTHILGRDLVNGIGGSADFTSNAYLSIFTCPSVVKGGSISTIVPCVSHVDHTEHSVHVLITEQGVADLRGRDPRERARLIADCCAHPDYRGELRRCVESVRGGHIPERLANVFAMHEQLERTGDMRGVDWGQSEVV